VATGQSHNLPTISRLNDSDYLWKNGRECCDITLCGFERVRGLHRCIVCASTPTLQTVDTSNFERFFIDTTAA